MDASAAAAVQAAAVDTMTTTPRMVRGTAAAAEAHTKSKANDPGVEAARVMANLDEIAAMNAAVIGTRIRSAIVTATAATEIDTAGKVAIEIGSGNVSANATDLVGVVRVMSAVEVVATAIVTRIAAREIDAAAASRCKWIARGTSVDAVVPAISSANG